MNIKPLYDRVVIEIENNQNVTSSGIVLPETSQERPQEGVIVAVGEGLNFDGDKKPMQVKVGDKVIFNRYAGVELKLNNKNYLIMREIDIIGVYND